MKKSLLFIVIGMCALILTGCEEKKNNVKLDSLQNTYWECLIDEYDYYKIWFYNGDRGKVELKTYTSDEKKEYTVGYSVKQSGYVVVTLFPGGYYEKEWLNGFFNGEEASLTLGGMKFTYKGKAQ